MSTSRIRCDSDAITFLIKAFLTIIRTRNLLTRAHSANRLATEVIIFLSSFSIKILQGGALGVAMCDIYNFERYLLIQVLLGKNTKV